MNIRRYLAYNYVGLYTGRVQQGVGNDMEFFGNVPTILFGDPGQPPAVGGTQLWSHETGNGQSIGQLAG